MNKLTLQNGNGLFKEPKNGVENHLIIRLLRDVQNFPRCVGEGEEVRVVFAKTENIQNE